MVNRNRSKYENGCSHYKSIATKNEICVYLYYEVTNNSRDYIQNDYIPKSVFSNVSKF